MRDFNQVITGSGKICRKSKTSYEIIFNKLNEIIFFQVFVRNSKDNNKRYIFKFSKEDFALIFNYFNKKYNYEPSISFTKNNKLHFLIIKSVKIINKKLVLGCSIKEYVDLSQTNTLKIPIGCFKNLRFFIDRYSVEVKVGQQELPEGLAGLIISYN